jgi:hypothetical protein
MVSVSPAALTWDQTLDAAVGSRRITHIINVLLTYTINISSDKKYLYNKLCKRSYNKKDKMKIGRGKGVL